jgi:hypothetical protein
MSDKSNAIARYNAYVAEVKAAVPAEKLLVFKVDQGWAPLCAFLGVPKPATEFPNVNDRAAIKKTIRDVIKGMYIVLAGYAVAAAALIYAIYRLLL